MASRVIFTNLFRASHVHLKERKSFQAGDTPSFMLSALFPKSGVGVIAKTGLQFPSHCNDIMTALQEVTAEEFGGWRFNPAECQMYGIQFPPQFKDGDKKLQKDQNGNPMVGVFDPITAGQTILTMKNTDPVGVVGPDAKDIDPSTVYSGCWVKAQLEVSAYTNGQKARIISIKLLNVMMCYHDESFGGKQPVQAASQAFAGMTIANSDIAAGTGQSFAPVPPVPTGLPVPPPVVIAPPPVPAVPVYVHTDATPKEQYLTAGWTIELLVQHGKGRMETPAPALPVPPVPVAPPAPPVPTPPPVVIVPPPVPAVPPPAPAIPLTGKVIMKADSPHTYDVLKSNGWNDDQIIAAGYATPNYTNP